MPEIHTALVKTLIRTQYPQWADLLVAPVENGGWDHRTFRLGERMLVRLPSAECYVAQVAKEHRWLPELGPRLPLPIPVPLGLGAPGAGYPWPWSVYRWLGGSTASAVRVPDLRGFAADLAGFLVALQGLDATGGPVAGTHNFHRGGSLGIYDAETRQSIDTLADSIDVAVLTEIWDTALAASWQGPAVWVHGDIAEGNLLVSEGRLCAVIDFGSAGIGDPSCDLVIAWTFLDPVSRADFRAALALDPATWRRARGWALWKALITLVKHRETNPAEATKARRVIQQVVADHSSHG